AAGSLDVAWDGPFCRHAAGALTLSLTLPHGGGVLTAAVTDTQRPSCLNPTTPGTMHTGVFRPGDADVARYVPPVSALRHLRSSVASHPAGAGPGEAIRYVIALSNPSSARIDLSSPVGFGESIGAGVPQLYRLNRRVIT